MRDGTSKKLGIIDFGIAGKLTKEEQVMVFRHDGNWECVDNERDLIHLNKLWSEKQAFWKIWD